MLSTCIAFDLSASIFPDFASQHAYQRLSDNRACPDMSQQVWCANVWIDRTKIASVGLPAHERDLVRVRRVLAHQACYEEGH